MKKPKGIFFIYAILVFLCLHSSAEAFSLRTNQSKIRLITPPGGAQTGVIEVENPSDTTLIVKVSIEDWKYTASHDGSKEFYPPGSTRFSCADWISFFPSQFILTPFSKQRVNYTAKTPAEFQEGRFAVMFFESTGQEAAKSESVGMNLLIRIGTLFYLEPSGLTKRQGTLSKFSCFRKPEDSSLMITFDFTNTGNIDITTSATFNIIDNKGVVHARGAFNDAYTFQGETALLSAKWSESIPAGTYTLIITLDLGKALSELGLGRGPVIVKEAQIEIGSNGQVLNIGELK
jgi:hypothetical protein